MLRSTLESVQTKLKFNPHDLARPVDGGSNRVRTGQEQGCESLDFNLYRVAKVRTLMLDLQTYIYYAPE